ncbi:mechanosensitive ion channel MscS [Methanocaldococcus villosus KIN24-T80]|uniref:Mechanosensitive ion channel MscS n=1 Tax=Methanocaldococcus villosus KIN24-T80 TaxID=1069083 RepID=N6UU93_9EURY|nr:mechanosensitive ion channel family protein [Methanocaldococcus villosus]ENN95919.1 mechanosensitive ion channel MscS [Methanocaldococcus villosus KIN24-T80]
MIEQIFIATVIIIFGVILVKIINYILKNWVKNIVINTKTKLDDILLDAIRLPLAVIILSYSILLALHILGISFKILTILDKTIRAIAIISATYFFVKFTDGIFKYYIIPAVEKTEMEFDDHVIKPLNKIIKIFIITIGILTALSAVGYDITALLASLGIGGLALALAMQDTIKNFIAGVLLLFDKPFSLGHWVKVDGVEGIVEEVGIRSVRIRTFDYTLITIPNSKLLESNIENLTVRDRRRVLMTIGLTYNTSCEKIKKAKEIIIKTLEEHRATLPPYRVHFVEYGDWSLNLRVEYFVRNLGFDYYLNTIEEVNLKIKEEFEKEGIEFAYPTYSIYLEKNQ